MKGSDRITITDGLFERNWRQAVQDTGSPAAAFVTAVHQELATIETRVNDTWEASVTGVRGRPPLLAPQGWQSTAYSWSHRVPLRAGVGTSLAFRARSPTCTGAIVLLIWYILFMLVAVIGPRIVTAKNTRRRRGS